MTPSVSGSVTYATIAEARAASGLRLIVSTGVPGPWGEAIKSVLDCKGVEYLLAGQEVGGENPALLAWTGQASAPVLAWEDVPPCISCVDQVLLAESIAAPALLPQDPELRAQTLGIILERGGRDGLGWQRRLQITQAVMASGKAPPIMQTMAARYGFSDKAANAAAQGLESRLQWLEARILCQQEAGSRYLVGAALTAADLYVANFVGMLKPLPQELNPMPAPMRASYSLPGPVVPDAVLAFRDLIYQQHIKTPLTF